MLALLPLCALLGLVLVLGNWSPELGWRRSFFRATVVMGMYTVLSTETLSLVRGITPLGLSLTWTALTLGMLGCLVRGAREGRPIHLPTWNIPASWFDRLLLLCVVAIVAVTALVAWFAPPNTWDSLTYHMSRVAHWAQNRSVGPYATGIERQNYMSPGAEIMVLHTYVLSGGDQLANFVQWFAMVASLVGVSVLARQLGSGTTGQLISAVFVATLPMGIAQASSTMTDYVVALWLVAVAIETLALRASGSELAKVLFVSLAAGLAILAKPTAFAYLAPFAIYAAVLLGRRTGFVNLLRLAAVSVCLVLLGNLGYFSRNLEVFGTPFGSSGIVGGSSPGLLDWRMVLSNVIRNASLHTGTPFPKLNHELYRAISGLHFKMGLDLIDPRTSAHGVFDVWEPFTDENRAGNTQHAVLLVLMVVGGLWAARKGARLPVTYVALVSMAFLLLSVLFKFTVFGSRYHTAFFVLAGPYVGHLLGSPRIRALGVVTGIALTAASWPWLVGIDNRPLISKPDGPGSILRASRDDLYLGPGKLQSLKDAADLVGKAECEEVGVMFGGDAPEYALWVSFGMPRQGVEIEWVVGGTPSARYEKPDFEPCAVVCDGSCASDLESIGGLPLLYNAPGMRLFLKPVAEPLSNPAFRSWQ